MSSAGPPSPVSRASSSILDPAGGLQRRLEHEVFRRIAGEKKFRQGYEIGAVASGIGARAPRLVGIAGDVADGRV